MIGIPIDIGFKSTTGRPIQEAYLNNNVPWASEAEALAGIDIGLRHKFMPLIIVDQLYWFKADCTTLEPVTFPATVKAEDVTLADLAGIFDAENVEDALAEVMGFANALYIIIQDLLKLKQNPYTINFTSSSGSVATRISAAIETTDYPTGWTLEVDDTYNLLVTHNLTGRKIADIKVFEINGSAERMLSFDRGTAYTGVVGNGLTVLIEGFAPNPLPMRVELIFN